MTQAEHRWWESGVVYQVYPRSFQDSNSDGVGDLKGITQRLDYLQWLGVDAVWISPIFPSPMVDFGYDITDYVGIHSLFGSMDDFDELLAAAHNRGLKVILDLVPNHTSDQHPWFLESRSSRHNPKRDWYLWRNPAEDGSEPNNWLSVFGGPAWEFDENTGQYYYHAYLKEQPDLNWRNPEVQREMFNAMKFWLDKGVDGFRVDVIWHMIKDAQYRDNPRNPDYREGMSPYYQQVPAYSTDQPEVHDVIRKMRGVIEQYDDRLLIGEIYLPINRLVTYYGEELSGVHLPFNFQLIVLPWDPLRIFNAINEYEASVPEGAWPNWVLGNHDKPRIAARAGRAQARVAAVLLLTLRGTPTLYYGDELGMENVNIPADSVQDPHEKNVPGLGLGRDPERTPMQWNSSNNAGFTDGEPWLPLAEDYRDYNVEQEKRDPGSFLNLYKRLLDSRRNHAALSVGRFVPIHGDEDIIAYQRIHKTEQFLVVLNFKNETKHFREAESHHRLGRGTVVLSTLREREGSGFDGDIELKPNEAVVILLEAGQH
jgi:alpha-glucosidase